MVLVFGEAQRNSVRLQPRRQYFVGLTNKLQQSSLFEIKKRRSEINKEDKEE